MMTNPELPGFDPAVATLAARVRTVQESRRERVIIGITGSPAAGKSTLAEQLVAELGHDAVWVPLDGFHLANSILDALDRRSRKGAPDTFDAPGYVNALQRIRQDGDHPVYLPCFHREIEESFAGEIAVTPQHRVVITEGNYLLLDAEPWSQISSLCDEVWFCEVDAVERERRLIGRHHGHGRSLADAQDWARRVDEPNADLVQATRVHAQVIITTTGSVGHENHGKAGSPDPKK